MISFLALVLAVTAGAADVPSEPPGGTPEDQQLWRELDRGAAAAVVQLARLTQCSHRISYARPYQRLDAAAAGGPKAVAERARALRAKLAAAAQVADDALPPDGGRVRACRYSLLYFGQRMDLLADPKISAEMPRYRDDARSCRDRMDALVVTLEPKADALEAVLAEVDTFLAELPAAVPGKSSAADTGPTPGRGQQEAR